jgi:hypothetical protein
MRDISEQCGENCVQNDDELYEQLDPLCWRDHVVNTLSASSGLGAQLVKTIYAEPYYGRTARMWGYSFCFEYRPSELAHNRGFIMLSRTHVAKSEQEARKKQPSLKQLLYELKNQVSSFPREKFGIYHPELDVPGYFGTLECCGEGRRGFFFMISQAGRKKPYVHFRDYFQTMKF